jgi:FdhD protein
MTGRPAVPCAAWKYSGGSFAAEPREIPVERPISIEVDGRELVTLLCLGDHLDELVAGYLRSEGLIAKASDLRALAIDGERGVASVTLDRPSDLESRIFGRRLITTGCGRGSVYSHAIDPLTARPVKDSPPVEPDALLGLIRDFHLSTTLHKEVGGVHGVGLALDGSLRIVREDIGRHNALDMISGRLLLDGIDGTGGILLTTGRISSEMLVKAAIVGAPVVVSLSAATSLAVSLAEKLGIALVGYARGTSFTVYTNPSRLAGFPATLA